VYVGSNIFCSVENKELAPERYLIHGLSLWVNRGQKW